MDRKETELRIETLLQEVCRVYNAYNPGGDYMGIVLNPSTGFVSFHNGYWDADSHRPLDFVTAAGKRRQTMTTCPCKDCPLRDPQCHGKCEMYREWRKELTAVRQKERLEKPESMEWQLYHKGR